MKELENIIEKKINSFKLFKTFMEEKVSKVPETPEEIFDQQFEVRLYNTELNFLFSDIVFCTNFLSKNYVLESEIVKEFHALYNEKLYKPNFHVDNKGIQENIKGFLEGQKKKHLTPENLEQFKQLLEASGPVN